MPSYCYIAFIPQQIDGFDIAMQDKLTNKEKTTPYRKPTLTQDQLHTFWSVFEKMEKEQAQISATDIDKDTISGELLRQRLIMTGELSENEVVSIIEGMEQFGNIEIVSYDTYRRKERKTEDFA